MPGAGEGTSEEWTELLRQFTTQGRRDTPEFKVSAETVKRLDNLIRRLEAMDQAGLPQLKGAPLPMPVPPPNFAPRNSTRAAPEGGQKPVWFSDLSNEKQSQVEQAFREHGKFIRREMSYEPNPGPTSPERMREIMEGSQEFLIDKLSGILDPDELDRFIQDLQSRTQ